MGQNPDFQELQQLLTPAQSVLVIISPELSLDKVAASLSLYLSLENGGKKIGIVSPQPMTVEFSSLVGVDKITDQIDGKNLVISFDYVKDSIEKISYNVENNKFNLVIQSKAGFPPLDTKSINYSYSGIESDLIFIIGAQKLEDLGKFYEKERSFYQEKPVVNLDNQPGNTQFGKLNIFRPQASSYSEIVAMILKDLQLFCNEDIANNLFLGLQSATENFQSTNVSADSFEAAAFCLRHGAQRATFAPSSKKKTKIASPDWLAPKIYKGTTRI